MAGVKKCPNPSCCQDWIDGAAVCVYCGHVPGTQLRPTENVPPAEHKPSTEAAPPFQPIIREPGRPTTESGIPQAALSPALLTIGATNVPIPVEPGKVTLGRLSSDDRIGKALNPYDDVGRYHATLVVRGNRVEVTDENSKHGTTVDDRRLPTGGTEIFDLPVMIRLASICYVRVEAR